MQENTNNSKTSDSADQPLAMTVYDLSDAQNHETSAQIQTAKQTTRGRLLMMGVFLICAAPVVFSYLTYYFIRPSATTSYGALVQPTKALPGVIGTVLKRPISSGIEGGASIELPALKGQWLWVSVGDAQCPAPCQQAQYFQKQIHTALGRERERLERVWMVTDAGAVDPALLESAGDAWVIRVAKADMQRWLGSSSVQAFDDHTYVVDPMGEMMMRFPAQLDLASAPKVRKDLERLLRASESWDLPGRGLVPKEIKDIKQTKDIKEQGTVNTTDVKKTPIGNEPLAPSSAQQP